MPSSITARRPRNFRGKILWSVIFLLMLLSIIAIATFSWFRGAAQAALPEIDGVLRVPGIGAPVSISRDARGVPNITASSMEDLYFAQGYVTAQDRLWEMDASRRYAAGEMAAAFGPKFIKQDKAQRLLGLRRIAEQAFEQLPPRDVAYLEAYARGVNAYIADHQRGLPLEMRIMRYFPRAWTPVDSLLVGTVMSEILSHGPYLEKLHHEAILARLGPELTADLYVNTSFHDLPPLTASGTGEIPPPPADLESEESSEISRELLFLATLAGRVKEEMPADALTPGSNNWVLSGAHTASGKPLLANDMHLRHQIPNIWYEVHLTAGEFDVAGLSIPGLPAVIVGHNRRIAWGITSLMPDTEDVYIEHFNQQGEYQTPSGWVKPELRHEIISVKRGKPESIDVVVTRHGPIITSTLKGETRQIALRWSGADPTALTFPFFDIDAASNWQDFRQALSRLGAPGLNFVYADLDGHIGYQAAGLFPLRATPDNALPVTGADDSHEWTGWIPFEELPMVFDPPAGIIATANGRITPNEYAHMLSSDWGAPYRTERIYRILRQERKFTPADMLALQTDAHSDFDRFLAQRFAYAIDHTPNTSKQLQQAADLLRRWNGQVDASSAAAAINQLARARLQRMLLESKLGTDFQLYTRWMAPVWLENTVLFQPERWLPKGYSDWNLVLSGAVESAIRDQKGSSDLSKWKYGEIFPVEVGHFVFAQIPILKIFASDKRPQSGNNVTVRQVGRNFGPSERFTADLSNWDNSTLNIVNGQSGNLFSTNFNDQWDAWYNGRTFQLPFSRSQVESSTAHQLTLMPQK